MRPLVDRLIVVVLSGRPVMLDGILPTADAVVAAWLPGTEGAGVADVLLGDAPFTGDDAVHLAADARRRAADRQGAVRRGAVPARLRPRRRRVACSATCGLPGVLNATRRR